MTKLSENEYWDSIFSEKKTQFSKQCGTGRKSILKRLLGPVGAEVSRSYYSFLLWNSLFPKYLPAGEGLKVIEIGSAPGNFLVEMSRRLGYEPYGIEYTENGADLNRRLFETNGLNPRQVYLEDFFSEDFHQQQAGQFDLVMSRGFIEHFEDVPSVIERHLNLLAPGGTLLVSIPRFRGLNQVLMKFFYRENLDIHNLAIMEKSVFEKQFDTPLLEPVFCDLFGTFNLDLFTTQAGSPKRHILRFFSRMQTGLNLLFWLCFGRKGCDTRFFSPYLIYIGRKSRLP